MQIQVRPANEKDISRICFIYNFEIENSVCHYETERHTPSSRLKWLKELQNKKYPVGVATLGKEVVGFAALTPFHGASGYKKTATGTLYVHHEFRRSGVAKALGKWILKNSQPFHCILAGINSENKASIEFHKSFGFEEVGRFKQIAYKNGRFHDDVCMQLILS